MATVRLTAVRLHGPAPPEVLEISQIVRRRSGVNLHVALDRDIGDAHQVESLALTILRLYVGVEDRPRPQPTIVSPVDPGRWFVGMPPAHPAVKITIDGLVDP